MANRKPQEVDASSIADIAFILLAFIIIATTLEKEEGIPAVLPQKRDTEVEKPPIVKQRNILEILVNKNDQLMIEGEWDKRIEDIKPIVMDFMTNPTNSEDYPELDVIDRPKCQEQIAIYKKLMEEAKDPKSKGNYKDKMEDWEGKYETVKLIGSYKTLPKSATIAIQYDKGTTYGTYLGVRDQVMSGINELRNRKCKEVFGVSYNELESIREEVLTEENKAQIKAIREVYPQKIIKLPARNVGG